MIELTVVRETDEWAIVYKPHGVPSAPIRASETGTVVDWFIAGNPGAAGVVGKKPVERGLLHRLDTATEGLVLIAKNQRSYDALSGYQAEDLIIKKYFARCSNESGKDPEPTPIIIQSCFRAFGPKGREVRPVFPQMRGFKASEREYTTVIEDITTNGTRGTADIVCALTRGFRHQVRAHLAYLAYPIIGDRLYNPAWSELEPTDDEPLCLFAFYLGFPDPVTGQQIIFSLPLPDKTIQ